MQQHPLPADHRNMPQSNCTGSEMSFTVLRKKQKCKNLDKQVREQLTQILKCLCLQIEFEKTLMVIID